MDEAVTGADTAVSVVSEWFSQLIRTPSGQVAACVFNAVLLLTHNLEFQGRLRWNAFKSVIEVKPSWGPVAQRDFWRLIEDQDVTSIRAQCDRTVIIGKDMMWDAVLQVAGQTVVHPIREYLSSIQWDNTPRLDRLFIDYFQAETPSPLVEQIGAKFAISAVARIYRPGCKVDTYPVFEGKQGTMKSSGIAALVGNREWFSDNGLNLDDQFRAMAIRGIWIYEVAELSDFTRADTNKLKSFVSSAEDKFRQPFGRTVQPQPRQTVFCATTNERDYVSDWTGERRKWPVAIKNVDLSAIERDRDQLWAEARVRFELGEPWYLQGAAAEQMAEEAMERHIDDPWIEQLSVDIRGDFLRRAGTPEFVTAAEVRDILELDKKSGQADAKRYARCLRRLGFTSSKRRDGAGTINIWMVPDSLRNDVDEARRGVAATKALTLSM